MPRCEECGIDCQRRDRAGDKLVCVMCRRMAEKGETKTAKELLMENETEMRVPPLMAPLYSESSECESGGVGPTRKLNRVIFLHAIPVLRKGSNSPELKTALTARELEHWDVAVEGDIVVLKANGRVYEIPRQHCIMVWEPNE